ncbi:MAG: hypothetical protein ACK4PK_08805 [Alphaproteobacteria bacterium]
MKSKFGNTPAAETPQAPDTESLKGWYLLRGYDAAHGPMASLMDLPEKDAIAKMKEIHPHRGTGPADENGNRPQETYYAQRRDADNWLRDFADNNDIARDRKNPTFFALTNDYEKVREAMAKGGSTVIAMPLEKADLSQWTFTAGDSMGNYLSKKNVSAFLTAEHALTGTAMDARKLAEVIKKGDIPKDAFEAQYWSSKPLPAEVVASPAAPAQKQPAQSAAAAPAKPAKP